MRSKIKYYITDVFSEKRYAGNQLATFINCHDLDADEMQHMAREINFSETTFILSDIPENGGYPVRIFTPRAEVDFAGHPTLGTAFIIRQHLIKNPVDQVILNLKVGQVPVRFSGNESDQNLWMSQVEPVFGKTLSPKSITPVLGLSVDDLDMNQPIQEVSTGLHHVIVPLKSMDALKKIRLDKTAYFKLIEKTWGQVVLAFCPGGYSEAQALGVRVFPVCYGIDEDPATGSGNGCLAAYLIRNRYFQSDTIDIATGQGYEIGRPSVLHLKAEEENGSIKIQVGGRVIPIAEGLWG